MMTGAARLTREVRLGWGSGVMSTPAAENWTVTVMAPATVPVCIARGDIANSAAVLPAGMLKSTTLPPVMKWMVESPGPTSGAKVKVR